MTINKNTFFNSNNNIKVFLAECCKRPIIIKFNGTEKYFFLIKVGDISFYCGECKKESKLDNFMDIK